MRRRVHPSNQCVTIVVLPRPTPNICRPANPTSGALWSHSYHIFVRCVISGPCRSFSVGRLAARVPADVLEGAHRLGDEAVLGIAELALADGHGRGAVEGMTARYQASAGMRRLQKAGLHLDG